MFDLIIRILLILNSPSTHELAASARALAPNYLTEEKALDHVVAAKLAATQMISAELLLGMAYVESRYTPEATSRMNGSRRETGVPVWTSPPASVSGPFFCGVTQSEAGLSWQKCLALRNVRTGYATTAIELGRWMRVCAIKFPHQDRLDCTLAGYGGGVPAILAGTSTYPARVRYRAYLLKKRLKSATT